MDYSLILSQVGLSKKEALVYLTLIEEGSLSLSSLSKSTGLNRPALYNLLPKMVKRGFISSLKVGKRIKYDAESPKRLLQLYESKQDQLKKTFTALQSQFDSNKKDKPVLKTYSGRSGIDLVFDDVVNSLPTGSTYYRYSAKTTPPIEKFKGTDYYKYRDKKKIERMVITSSKKAIRKKNDLNRHTKAIPKNYDLFDDNVSLLIYGDKTAYVDYNTNTSFVIESKTIAEFQEKLYKLLWKKL